MRWIVMSVLALIGTIHGLPGCDDATDGDGDVDADGDGDGDGDGDASACAAMPGAALASERCTVCHGLVNITSADYDESGWTTVVDTMIGRGASLNATERQEVIDYLVCAR